MSRTALLRAAALLICASTAVHCADAPAGDVHLGEADLDEAQLDAGKADGDPCAEYEDGELLGDDLLTLVNKADDHQLSMAFEPSDLTAIPTAYMMTGRTGVLRAGAVAAFKEMANAAKAEKNLKLRARSPYRSFVDQCVTMNYYRRVNGEAYAKSYVAPPGRSQHQLGTAVDVTSVNANWQAWLAKNATRFGFVLAYPANQEELTGYSFEPWHYRYIGKAAAAELTAAGLILEQYLERCEAEDPALTCPRE